MSPIRNTTIKRSRTIATVLFSRLSNLNLTKISVRINAMKSSATTARCGMLVFHKTYNGDIAPVPYSSRPVTVASEV
jgi:hypothetical protein